MEKRINIEFSGEITLVYKDDAAKIIVAGEQIGNLEELMVPEMTKLLSKMVEDTLEGDDTYEITVESITVE